MSHIYVCVVLLHVGLLQDTQTSWKTDHNHWNTLLNMR